MPLIGFLYNRDRHTHKVVNCDGRKTVGIATDGRRYNVVQVHIEKIFRIMQDTLLVERQHQDVASVEAAEASVATTEAGQCL
jgi:hypothetical protein